MSTRRLSRAVFQGGCRRRRRARSAVCRAVLVAWLAAPVVALAGSARADDDPLASYRDRFRLGMDRYRAGAMAEAIRVWGAITDEIGPQRGYRLSFNLGRAYDTNGEATRAAERYRAFLDEAEARRAAGEPLEPMVERETNDASERIAALNESHGRIEIKAGPNAVLAQVDATDPRLGAFTAYVAPGKHVVTFSPGTRNEERVEVTVALGELVVTQPTAPPPAWVDAGPIDTLPIVTHHQKKYPFSPVVLYVGAAVTAVSIAAPILAYGHAYSLYDTYYSPSSTLAARNSAAAAYNGGATSLAYGMLAVPIALGAVTGGLTIWYFAGAKNREVGVGIAPVMLPGGGAATVTGRF